MPIGLNDKKEIVAGVAQIAGTSLSVVAADYRGLTAPQMTSLREQARESGVTLQMVRNTLAKRAFADTPYVALSDHLVGTTILAFAANEPGAAAKLIRDFSKKNNSLKVKAISVGANIYSAEQIDAVANLPTKEEAIAKLMSVMQAPITKLARTMAEPQAKLTRTLAAVRSQKEQAA